MTAVTKALLIVLAVDQLAKAGVDRLLVARVALGPKGVLRLQRGRNSTPLAVPARLVLFAAVAVALSLEWRIAPYPRVPLGVALGGVASNTFDRVWRGGVFDFIGVGRWPLFNLADAAIVAGVAGVVVGV